MFSSQPEQVYVAFCISEGTQKAEADSKICIKSGHGVKGLALSPGLHSLQQVDIRPISLLFRDLNLFLSNENG